MNAEKDTPPIEAPSMANIAKATLAAILVAAAVLFVAVLPAEYGIDPLGTGSKLGLTDLAKASGTPQIQAAIPEASIMPLLDPVEQPGRWGESPVMKGAFLSQPNRYNVDSRTITLKPGEGMEIKYNMKKGAGLVYSWAASAKLIYDFHGMPDVLPEGKVGTDYFESYDRDDKVGKDQFHGTFVAPRTGIHGWFWENTGPDVVTIRLVTAGFYDWVFQNVNDHESSLKSMDAYSLPSHPTIPDEPFR